MEGLRRKPVVDLLKNPYGVEGAIAGGEHLTLLAATL